LHNPESMVFLTLVPMNKSIKFCIKQNRNFFLSFFLLNLTQPYRLDWIQPGLTRLLSKSSNRLCHYCMHAWSNNVIKLSKQGKKNLPEHGYCWKRGWGRRLGASHGWRSSLLFTVETTLVVWRRASRCCFHRN